ncbi:MAG: ABC transporter ATP-binding protein, partial [Flavobacteriales bacterium]
EGQILIDGKDLKTINLNDFRNSSGIVPQDVFLFSDTIANNIRFGVKNDEVDQHDIEASARKAHVFDNIVSFPDKFETLLGERGVNLSGGQKQRISIARALIRKPKLLLLDDCLSAVDTETEEIILSNLKESSESQTTIIVSHRVSSLRNADKVIVIDQGKLMEKGTHDELIASGGLYADMYYKQLAEEN